MPLCVMKGLERCMTRSRERISFGDFQTPRSLANEVCRLLSSRGVMPQTIVEPTCGIGNFLMAAAEQFPEASRVVGAELNPTHLAVARSVIRSRQDAKRFRLLQASFFESEWPRKLSEL